MATHSPLRVGLHLYTVRDDLKKDPEATLRAVAGMGYRAVSGLGLPGGRTPAQARDWAKGLGLDLTVEHVSLEEIERTPDAALDRIGGMGVAYATLAWVNEDRRKTAADIAALATALNGFGKSSAARGIRFQYHNHDFEFRPVEGATYFDRLLGATDPATVGIMLDVGWVQRAGGDPVAWLKKLGNRVRTIHLKDTTANPDGRWAEIGRGVLDVKRVLATCRELGVEWALVEQDTCDRPPLESAAISFETLRALGAA
jgi:sugar phosphate isomerase/epimerase